MINLEYKRKNYSFSSKSSIIFIVFCPLIAFLIVLTTRFFWSYLDPLYIYPATFITNLLVGKPSVITQDIYFHLHIPDSIGVYFSYGCSPYPAFALFVAITLMTPLNTIKEDNNTTVKRKFLTFIVPSIIVFVVNSFRIALTIYLYHIGTPYYPMHDILEYITTFITVFTFFICSYYWLPEIIISGMWSIEIIKYKISKNSSAQNINQPNQAKKIKTTYILAVWMPVCIFIGTSLSILVYLKVF